MSLHIMGCWTYSYSDGVVSNGGLLLHVCLCTGFLPKGPVGVEMWPLATQVLASAEGGGGTIFPIFCGAFFGATVEPMVPIGMPEGEERVCKTRSKHSTHSGHLLFKLVAFNRC